jgi:hypothetical protein
MKTGCRRLDDQAMITNITVQRSAYHDRATTRGNACGPDSG